jgi:hypothetical protein
MNKESGELSQSNKEFTADKQAETLGTRKMQEKLRDRDADQERSSKSELPGNEDRSGKTIEEKREIHSDGPRADSDKNTAAETHSLLPGNNFVELKSRAAQESVACPWSGSQPVFV